MNAKEEMESLSSSTSNNISRKYSVEKLTTYNYRMWKTRMELILERANLKELVDGSMSIPKIDNELKQWKSRDLDARMEIIMHLSDEQVDHVRDLETAQQMWEYLRKLHQPSDGTTKIFSYRTLMNLEMHEGEQLDAVKIGNNIDETSKCEILMGDLP